MSGASFLGRLQGILSRLFFYEELNVTTIAIYSRSDLSYAYGSYDSDEGEGSTALVDLGRVSHCRDNDVDAMGVGAAAAAPCAAAVWTLSVTAASVCLMLSC